MKRYGQWMQIALGLIVLIGTFHYYYAHREREITDHDAFYHYAVSQLMAENGIIKTLPQVTGLGWHEYFPEKEFLFHGITALAFSVGGRSGVNTISYLIGLATIALLYVIMLRSLQPLPALLLLLTLVAANHLFLYRTLMVRAYLLAIFLFVGMLFCIQLRHRTLAALVAALYALAYHALYLPLGLALLAMAFFWKSDITRRQTGIAIAAGTVVGTLINPYFPSTVVSMWQHLMIALFQKSLPVSGFGAELLAPPLGQFIILFWVHLIAIAFSLLFLWYLHKYRNIHDRHQLFMAALCVGLWLLAMRNPRAADFAIPVTALCTAPLLAFWQKDHSRWLNTGLAVFCSFFLLFLLQFHGRTPARHPTLKHANAAVALIPTTGKHNVFTCDWSLGPYLMNGRSNLYFPDLLDPTYLYLYNRSLFFLRHDIAASGVSDIAAKLKKYFKADYYFCFNHPHIKNLLQQNDLELAYPAADKLDTAPLVLLKVR